MPATTGDHMDRAFCRLYEQLKARAEAEGTDLGDGAEDGRSGTTERPERATHRSERTDLSERRT